VSTGYVTIRPFSFRLIHWEVKPDTQWHPESQHIGPKWEVFYFLFEVMCRVFVDGVRFHDPHAKEA
jgi:hypothetical protein